jgi:hypothetical protein
MNKEILKVKRWTSQECMFSASVHTDSNDQFIKSKANHDSRLLSSEEIEW